MKIKFLIISFLITFIGFSQKDKPQPVDISYAKALKEKYEDEDVVIKNNIVEIFFYRNTKTNKVEVKQTKKIEFIAIAQRAELGYSSGYDNQSSINSLKLLDNRNKEVDWFVHDEAYSDESIFHNDYRVKYGSFSLPTQGYTRTVKEEKYYKDIKYFTTAYFIENYRTIYGELILHIPDWLELDIKAFNLEGYNIKTTNSSTDDGQDMITYTFRDIRPVMEEPKTPGSSFIYPHILFLPKSFKNDNSGNIKLFTDTKDLYDWYMSLVSEVDIQNDAYRAKVEELVDDKTTDEEKIKAIYYWVQDNIKYIAFVDGLAGFKPDAPQNVFSKRYGDCKGMSILLKSMLVQAGFDARLVWIGTNALAYDYSTPSLAVDNHMITAVVKDNDILFLDGTEKYNAYGSFASRIQGKQALIENGDNFILKTVPVSKPSDNKELYVANFKIEDDALVGNIQKTLSGEQFSQFLYGYHNTPKDVRNDAINYILKDNNPNTKVSDIKGFDDSNRDEVINLNYNVKIDGNVSYFGDDIYLELDPVKYLYNNEILEDRVNPIEFYFTNVDEKIITLDIPEGYEVSSFAEDIIIDNAVFLAEASFSSTEEQVIYKSNITFKKKTINKTEFESWNKAIQQLKTFYDEQLVLVKKQ
jgi:hypothetical protein